MIKGIALAKRKAGMAENAFHDYWRDVHGPIAARIDVFKRYVQSHRIAEPFPGFDNCPYDGVAEIWFDEPKHLAELPNNPQYIEGARADEPNFVDMESLHFLTTREHVFIEGPKIEKYTSRTKAIFLLHRRPDLSVEEFQDYWINGHAPLIPRDAGIVRYVQCHQLADTYADSTPAYDGVAELSFENIDAFNAYWNSDRIQAIFAADAPKFLDGENCTAFLAEETRVVWD